MGLLGGGAADDVISWSLLGVGVRGGGAGEWDRMDFFGVDIGVICCLSKLSQ